MTTVPIVNHVHGWPPTEYVLNYQSTNLLNYYWELKFSSKLFYLIHRFFQALDGDCGFLAANLYAKSVFGEDALANIRFVLYNWFMINKIYANQSFVLWCIINSPATNDD